MHYNYFTIKLLLYCTSVPNSFLLNINYQSVFIVAQNNFQGIYKGHDEGSENLGLKVDDAKKHTTEVDWMIFKFTVSGYYMNGSIPAFS